jgi:hypothetical protein
VSNQCPFEPLVYGRRVDEDIKEYLPVTFGQDKRLMLGDSPARRVGESG